MTRTETIRKYDKTVTFFSLNEAKKSVSRGVHTHKQTSQCSHYGFLCVLC